MSSQQALVIKSSDGAMKCSGPEKMVSPLTSLCLSELPCRIIRKEVKGPSFSCFYLIQAVTKSPKTTRRSKAILAKPISQLPPKEGTNEDTISVRMDFIAFQDKITTLLYLSFCF